MTSWSWDFGDESAPSSLQNPSHSYVAEGTYTVTLTVDGECLSDSVSMSVEVCVPPTAAFSHSPDPPDAGQQVQFTDLSSDDTNSWYWDFGDGSDSVEQNPTHTYAAEGTYTVSLTAGNGCVTDDVSASVLVCELIAPSARIPSCVSQRASRACCACASRNDVSLLK